MNTYVILTVSYVVYYMFKQLSAILNLHILTYAQAEKDHTKTLDDYSKLEGATAANHQATIREREFEVNVHNWYGKNECKFTNRRFKKLNWAVSFCSLQPCGSVT